VGRRGDCDTLPRGLWVINLLTGESHRS
jgi:hypothetical protein